MVEKLINKMVPLTVKIIAVRPDVYTRGTFPLVNSFAKVMSKVISFSPLFTEIQEEPADVTISITGTAKSKVYITTHCFFPDGSFAGKAVDATISAKPMSAEVLGVYKYRACFETLQTHKEIFMHLAQIKYVFSKRCTDVNYTYQVVNEVKAQGDDLFANVVMAYEQALNEQMKMAAVENVKKTEWPTCEMTCRMIHDLESPTMQVRLQLEKKAPEGMFQGWSLKDLRNSRSAPETLEQVQARLQSDIVTPMSCLGADMGFTSAVQTVFQWKGVINLQFTRDWQQQLLFWKEQGVMMSDLFTSSETELELFNIPPVAYVVNLSPSTTGHPILKKTIEQLRAENPSPLMKEVPWFDLEMSYEKDSFIIRIIYEEEQIEKITLPGSFENSPDEEEAVTLKYCRQVIEDMKKKCVKETILPFLFHKVSEAA